jgi:hypothetical protein
MFSKYILKFHGNIDTKELFIVYLKFEFNGAKPSSPSLRFRGTLWCPYQNMQEEAWVYHANSTPCLWLNQLEHARSHLTQLCEHD